MKRRSQRGVTIIETLGVLAIASMMLIGMSAMINSALDDTKGQQAALYQSQVVAAAIKYINANYTTFSGTASTPIDLNTLKTNNFLPSSFAATNAYGQTSCVVVRPAAGYTSSAPKFDAIVFASGPTPIPPADIPSVAASAGTGGGYIKKNQATGLAVAQGSTWSLDNTSLGNFTTSICPGVTTPTIGSLASALFFDSPGQLSTDFLYRDRVPGHDDLNAMNTPLHMRAVVTADTSDSLCSSTIVPDPTGRIAADSSGAVLSCQNGFWRKQPARHWRDPVLNWAALQALPATANEDGDVRMLLDKSVAYTWQAATNNWVPLGIDASGNLTVPKSLTANSATVTNDLSAANIITNNKLTTQNLRVKQIATAGGSCDPAAPSDGNVALSSTGILLSCQSDNTWHAQASTDNIGSEILQWTSTFGPSPPNTSIDYAVYISDLNSAGGKPPYYMTGRSQCESISDTRSFISYDLIDTAGRTVGFVGECGALSDATSGRVFTKASLGLQKIPDNVQSIAIHIEPSNYLWTEFHIFSTQ